MALSITLPDRIIDLIRESHGTTSSEMRIEAAINEGATIKGGALIRLLAQEALTLSRRCAQWASLPKIAVRDKQALLQLVKLIDALPSISERAAARSVEPITEPLNRRGA